MQTFPPLVCWGHDLKKRWFWCGVNIKCSANNWYWVISAEVHGEKELAPKVSWVKPCSGNMAKDRLNLKMLFDIGLSFFNYKLMMNACWSWFVSLLGPLWWILSCGAQSNSLTCLMTGLWSSGHFLKFWSVREVEGRSSVWTRQAIIGHTPFKGGGAWSGTQLWSSLKLWQQSVGKQHQSTHSKTSIAVASKYRNPFNVWYS